MRVAPELLEKKKNQAWWPGWRGPPWVFSDHDLRILWLFLFHKHRAFLFLEVNLSIIGVMFGPCHRSWTSWARRNLGVLNSAEAKSLRRYSGVYIHSCWAVCDWCYLPFDCHTCILSLLVLCHVVMKSLFLFSENHYEQTLGSLNNKIWLSHSSKGWKSQVKVSIGLASGETALLALAYSLLAVLPGREKNVLGWGHASLSIVFLP